VGDVLVGPSGRVAPLHPADSADAVDDRLVVPTARLRLEQFGVLAAGRLVADFPLVVDEDRVGRVETGDVMAFNVNAGDAVDGGRNDETMVEADLQRAGGELAVPVDLFRPLAQPQVPL